MSQGLIERRIEAVLETVQKPSRYIGGEVNQVRKPGAQTLVALCYPDAYEVGISNQALQILYKQVNDRPHAAAERVYCPWPDMADAMRREGLPLFTLESWRPVREADLLAFTLQAELTYSNVLEVLDLAGIPLRAADRGDGDPIVIAGGPSASNPAPLAPFFDAFFVGESEGAFDRILAAIEAESDRSRRIDLLAADRNVYVPSHGRRRPVERAIYTEFGIETHPRSVVVPYSSAIFSRASVEVMRGCTRGCRFCHAGTWYRPVRERPADQVIEAGLAQLACTGYDELSLTSLATSDYTDVVPAIEGIKRRLPTLHLSLPSNRVDTGPVALTAAANARQSSITLAPEAATQRMRDIICKTITNEMIENAMESAFKAGYTSLKLYFMIGLPRETHDEVQGIVDLGIRAREIGRRVRPDGRFSVHVSASNFVPKPHTPFQWEGMEAREQLAAKQAYMRRSMPTRQIRLSLHDLRTSMLEGALARAGEETADVIEAAWRLGARFDAWSEMFREDAWEQAFAAAGTSIDERATHEFGEWDELPWDHVRSGVSKEFLLDEWWQSRAEVATGDCRWDGCADCGACFGPVRNKLVN
jgi:radical SAM family uncharacterized protein